MQVAGGERRRFRPPRRRQVVVGAGRLASGATGRLPRRLEALGPLGLLGPERIEPPAGRVALGRALDAPGVLLLDRVPAPPRPLGRLVEGSALRGMVRGPLPGGLGALRPAPRFGLLARNVTRGGAQVGGRFLGGPREIAQARQRRQGRRHLLARRSVVGGDARQLVLEAGLPLLVGRFLVGEPSFGGGDGRQHAGHPLDVEGAQPFGDARRLPPGRRGREQRLMGGRRGPLVLGRRDRVPARRLARRLQLREVRGGVVGKAGGRLRQPLAQLLGLVPGRSGQRARRLELVGAPDLAQDAAAVGRPVLHQQPREAALGQDDGAQERVAVEPDQGLDAVVDGLHLLDLLDRLAVGPEPA